MNWEMKWGQLLILDTSVLMGVDTTDLDGLMDLVTEREHKFPGSYLRRAMAGFDTAVWDARGKRAGKPVAALLGGSAGTVRAYGSSMKRDITPKAEAERLKRLQGEQGFDAFKFRVGAECGRDRDQWPGRTEEIIPAMRAALGEGVDLLADANSGFSPARAIEVGRIMEDNRLCHYEERFALPESKRPRKSVLPRETAPSERSVPA